jgi:hypothetical protein
MSTQVFVQAVEGCLTSKQEKALEALQPSGFTLTFLSVKEGDQPEVMVWNNGLIPKQAEASKVTLCFNHKGRPCFVEHSTVELSKKESFLAAIRFPEVEKEELKKRLTAALAHKKKKK